MKLEFKKKRELELLSIKELEKEQIILNQHINGLQTLIDKYDKSLSLFKKDLKEFVKLYKNYYLFAKNNSKFVDDIKSEASLLIFSKSTKVKKLIISNSAKSEILKLYKQFTDFGDKMFENIRPYVSNKMADEYEPRWVLLTSKKYSLGRPEVEFEFDSTKSTELSTQKLDNTSDETKALSAHHFPFDIYMDSSKLESKTFDWFFDLQFEVQTHRYMDPWGFRVCSKKDLINSLNEIKDEIEPYARSVELKLRASHKGKEKIENIGYVYVLSNKAYPNIYKIGSTYSLPEERAEELTGTGHLTPFKVVGKIKIQSAEYYEKSIHKLLNKFRVKQGREFFKLDLIKIKECLKQVSSISEKGSKKITLMKMQKEIKF